VRGIDADVGWNPGTDFWIEQIIETKNGKQFFSKERTLKIVFRFYLYEQQA